MITIVPFKKPTIEKIKPLVGAMLSVLLNAGAIVTAVKATAEATRIIDEKKQAPIVNKKDIAKEVAPKFVAPAILFTAAQILTVSSVAISVDRSLLLGGALAAANNKFEKYRETTSRLYGDDADEKIMVEIAKENVHKYVDYSDIPTAAFVDGEGPVSIDDKFSYHLPEGKLLFFDDYRYGQPMTNGQMNDGYFVCTANQFQQARLYLNREFAKHGDAALNDWYSLLGIGETIIGDELYWDMSAGYQFIDITLRPLTMDDGLVVYEVLYKCELENWYDDPSNFRLGLED